MILLMKAQTDDYRDWHGHVRQRPDGMRMRCGGPRMCTICKAEADAHGLAIPRAVPGYTPPTEEQKLTSKYPKPKQDWYGLTIAIEQPAGTVREGVDETGRAWRTVFKYAYGEVLRSEGADGDPVDVFMGLTPDAPEVYIVRQMKRKEWHVYDEDKCFLGFDSMESAKAAYLAHYDDPRFFGGIVAMPRDEFIAKVRATAKAPGMLKSVLFLRNPRAAS